MEQDTATQPQAETGYSEEAAAQEILERWQGRQKADAEPAEQESDAAEPTETEAEQGEEPQAEGEEEAAPADAEVEYEVEFAGQTHKLPKGTPEEVARSVQELGQNLHRDYTKKTQEVAEIRKAADAERETAREMLRMTHEHADLMADLRTVQRQIDLISQADLSALSETDPMEAQRKMVQLIQLQQAQQRIGAQLQTTVGEMTQKRTAAMADSLAKAQAELQREIKDWGPQKQQALRQYAANIGFSDAELSQITDARIVKLLHKAQQYDALQSSKPALTKKVASLPPKTLKQTAAGTVQTASKTRADEAMKRLKSTGSMEDAAAALLARARIRK